MYKCIYIYIYIYIYTYVCIYIGARNLTLLDRHDGGRWCLCKKRQYPVRCRVLSHYEACSERVCVFQLERCRRLQKLKRWSQMVTLPARGWIRVRAHLPNAAPSTTIPSTAGSDDDDEPPPNVSSPPPSRSTQTCVRKSSPTS